MTGTLLTTVEVAERLGLSSAAVQQAVRTGALQPTARTADDFLFSERAVSLFAERRARAAALPLEPPPAGSRAVWSGDVDRLNAWLKDLTDAVPQATAPQQTIVLPPRPEPQPKPPPPPEVPTEPVPEPGPPAPPPEIPPEPEPEPPPVPEPAPEPEPVAVAEVADPGLAAPAAEVSPSSGLSRQAILVIEPIDKFRVLREVSDRLLSIPGIADARLERLESGLATYRVSFGGQKPAGEAIAAALGSLGLSVMMVDSQ